MQNTAVLFSGQGAQFPGMSNGLDSSVFDIASRVLGRDILKLCSEGPQEELNLTKNTQPCLLTVDLAMFQKVHSKVSAVAGFSLGEYAALVAAGVLDIEDAFRIIQIRADAMQQAVPVGEGAMAAIMKIPPQEVQALCDETEGYVTPANFNTPTQTVVSGETAAVAKLLAIAKNKKIRGMILPVSAPFHCKLMEPVAQRLAEEFKTVKFHDAKIPIYMNVDGKPETDGSRIKEKLVLQTKSPVYWVDTMKNMQADGIDSFIECGPGKTLTSFVQKTLSNVDLIEI